MKSQESDGAVGGTRTKGARRASLSLSSTCAHLCCRKGGRGRRGGREENDEDEARGGRKANGGPVRAPVDSRRAVGGAEKAGCAAPLCRLAGGIQRWLLFISPALLPFSPSAALILCLCLTSPRRTAARRSTFAALTHPIAPSRPGRLPFPLINKRAFNLLLLPTPSTFTPRTQQTAQDRQRWTHRLLRTRPRSLASPMSTQLTRFRFTEPLPGCRALTLQSFRAGRGGLH
jgi:hypothetical protein